MLCMNPMFAPGSGRALLIYRCFLQRTATLISPDPTTVLTPTIIHALASESEASSKPTSRRGLRYRCWRVLPAPTVKFGLGCHTNAITWSWFDSWDEMPKCRRRFFTVWKLTSCLLFRRMWVGASTGYTVTAQRSRLTCTRQAQKGYEVVVVSEWEDILSTTSMYGEGSPGGCPVLQPLFDVALDFDRATALVRPCTRLK